MLDVTLRTATVRPAIGCSTVGGTSNSSGLLAARLVDLVGELDGDRNGLRLGAGLGRARGGDHAVLVDLLREGDSGQREHDAERRHQPCDSTHRLLLRYGGGCGDPEGLVPRPYGTSGRSVKNDGADVPPAPPRESYLVHLRLVD